MPGGKKVTPLFGALASFLSLYFGANENKALALPQRAHPYVVVLDPGHGGADTGAVGKQGKKAVREKDVALALALKTEQVLRDPAFARTLGRPIQVVLTRRRDIAVSLEERSEKARQLHADLFVSIHANSDPTHKARGLETYFLNNTDDEASLKLQQIENRSSKRAQGGKDASLLLRTIAADAVVDASREAAGILHSSLVDQLRSEEVAFQDRGVKQAMLYVLLDSQVPAVLVESFYVSHPKDRDLVSQPENRAKIAEGLAKGVLRFLATK